MNKKIGIDRELYLKLARVGYLEDEALQSDSYAEHWAAYKAEQAAASAPTDMFAAQSSELELKIKSVSGAESKEAIEEILSGIAMLTDGQAHRFIDSVLVNPHINPTEKRSLLNSLIETGTINEEANSEPHARITECTDACIIQGPSAGAYTAAHEDTISDACAGAGGGGADPTSMRH